MINIEREITMKKTVFNVNPWNELYYDNCYYSALFAMLLHFNRSITPILLSDFFVYGSKDDVLELTRKRLYDDRADLISQMGIKEDVYTEVDDVIACIRKCIDRDNLPMVWIDCFYESIRPDAYQKNHWGHILLVYGYDDEKETVEFLEHSYTDSFTYKRANMSYSDFKLCYESMKSRMKDFSGFIEFSEKDREPVCSLTVESVKSYIDYMKKNKEVAYKGIESLFNSISLPDDEMINWLSKALNSILKYKQMERYIYKKGLKCGKTLLKMSTDILMQWRNIFGLLAHVFDKDKSFTELRKCLYKVAESEKEFLDKAYEFIDIKDKQMNYLIADIEPLYNGISISNTGNVPEGCEPYQVSANPIVPDSLPESNSILNFEGVPIRMPDKSDEVFDHIIPYGQEISLKPEKYIRLYILGVGEIYSNIKLYSNNDIVEEQSIFFHDAWTGIDIWEAGSCR